MPDETTPEEPQFVLKASDPSAPFALLAYASSAKNKGADTEYVRRIKALAQEFYKWQDAHGIIPSGMGARVNDKIQQMSFGKEARGAHDV